jgi:PAS domain-containing protein
VEGGRQKSIVLILAREFAATLATPMFVTDADGRLVFYNEPAEELLGQTFAETGEISAAEFVSLFHPEDREGKPLPIEKLPSRIAFLERRPAHSSLHITALDGTKREISSTAFPLFVREDEFLGVLAIFWERD